MMTSSVDGKLLDVNANERLRREIQNAEKKRL